MFDRRFAATLALSLLLHGLVLSAPAWRLPAEESQTPVLLEAMLVAPAPKLAVPAPVAKPRPPVPRRRMPAPAPAPAAAPQPPAEPAPEESMTPVQPVAEVAPPPIEPAPTPAVLEPGNETAGALPTAQTQAGTDAGQVSVESLPANGRIRYVLTRGEGGLIVGEVTQHWRTDGSTYAIESAMETVGLAALLSPAKAAQTSEGSVSSGGLMPHEFRQVRDGKVTDLARFDWQAMKLTYRSGRKPAKEATLTPGAQDVLSQVYQAGLLAAAGSTRIEMMIATGKRYDRYVYQTVGEERIKTGAGELRVLHLRAESDGQAYELWLARDHHHLPVRVRYRERAGEVYDQTAEKIEYDGQTQGN